jgi:hypothetical protein
MRTFIVLLAAVLATGCATGKTAAKSDVQGSTAAEYYPLKIGNSWTYEVKFLGQKQVETIVVEKVEGEFFVMKTSNPNAEPPKIKADAYGVRDEKRYLIREPVQAGTTWTNVVSVETTEHYKILSVGSGCEAVAGKFSDCVVVESRQRLPENKGLLINQMTFARGIGVVRIATEIEANGQRLPQVSLDLSAFTLGNEGKKP